MQFTRILCSATFAALLAAPALAAFDPVECLANKSKAECTRMMLIEDALSKPLREGDEVMAESGKYSISISGEGWLRNGWSGNNAKAKDLGLIKDNGTGKLEYQPSAVKEAEFESVLTSDMQGLYDGLKEGFRKAKIEISSASQLELMPLNVTGGSGMLGRFCYRIEAGNKKSACVYEGFIRNANNGDVVKLLGSVGDFANMREEAEAIIASFRFKENQ